MHDTLYIEELFRRAANDAAGRLREVRDRNDRARIVAEIADAWGLDRGDLGRELQARKARTHRQPRVRP
ncbi:MAG: hypothetical protein ACYC8T_27695 [Myxococcaceae bacterium]